MFRFVDLTAAYWATDEGDEPGKPCCGIIDTVTDCFLENSFGCHVLDSIDEVREAAGERGVALIPQGFFG